MIETPLHLDEANELLAAWAQRLAAARGIRLLAIKGRVLGDDGLGPPRTSADVDILLDPAGFDDFCDAAVAAGWEEFPSTFASTHFTLHSRSFRREGWPNSFDVHNEYPGMLRPPAEVFDALWAGRRIRLFAHQEVAVPSRAGNAIILALHSLRGTHKQARHQNELDSVTSASFDDRERAELAALARATGSAPALADVLPQWGVVVAADPELEVSAAYAEWRRKVAESEGAAASWLILLRNAPWRGKAEIVRRALWPSRTDFALDHPEVGSGLGAQLGARLQRLGRGLSRLPAALKVMRR